MIARCLSALLVLALLAGCGDAGNSRCGGGARPNLSVWAEKQHRIGATFRLAGAHPGVDWRLVVVHEGHVAFRGRARGGADGGLKVTHRMGGYPGADRVLVRAYGPDGATCAATARLSDDV